MQQTLALEEIMTQIVETVWGTVLGFSITPETDSNACELTPELSVTVHITGTWNGAVLFWPTNRFAKRAAAIFFDLPEAEVTMPDIQDAMAELGNMLAGNLKSLLPGPCALSLPTVTRGAQHEIFMRRAHQVARIEFSCDGEPLSFQLLQSNQAA